MGGGRQAVENLARIDNTQAILTNTSNINQNNPQNTPAGRRIQFLRLVLALIVDGVLVVVFAALYNSVELGN